jgi:hypothetical protein
MDFLPTSRQEINFYTQGYVPVRLVSFHPRPHSRVRSSSCAIALSFSCQVDVSKNVRSWVQARGHKLLPPRYDTHTCTLIYPFETPPPPGRVHVMLHAGLVAGGGAGAEGSSMMPLQPDGITRSNSVVRWQFYCSDESRYETHNLSASGLLHVMARWVKHSLRARTHHSAGDVDEVWHPRAQGHSMALNPGIVDEVRHSRAATILVRNCKQTRDSRRRTSVERWEKRLGLAGFRPDMFLDGTLCDRAKYPTPKRPGGGLGDWMRGSRAARGGEEIKSAHPCQSNKMLLHQALEGCITRRRKRKVGAESRQRLTRADGR